MPYPLCINCGKPHSQSGHYCYVCRSYDVLDFFHVGYTLGTVVLCCLGLYALLVSIVPQ